MFEVITLVLDVRTRDGQPAFEEVVVEPLGDGRYRLVQSPGLLLDLAADDVFTRNADGTFEHVRRGRNLCIQIFAKIDHAAIEAFCDRGLGALGGRLDGKTPSSLVYTVAVDVGFRPVEQVLDEMTRRFPAATWMYGNVYDVVDGTTPLNWW